MIRREFPAKVALTASAEVQQLSFNWIRSNAELPELYRNNRVRLDGLWRAGSRKNIVKDALWLSCMSRHVPSCLGQQLLETDQSSGESQWQTARNTKGLRRQYSYRAPRAVMLDWARIRADTPAAEKVLHFNNAGRRRAALSVRTYVTR